MPHGRKVKKLAKAARKVADEFEEAVDSLEDEGIYEPEDVSKLRDLLEELTEALAELGEDDEEEDA